MDSTQKKIKIRNPNDNKNTESSLETWVGGIAGNSTLVVVVPGHHDVAIHTPTGTPALTQTDKPLNTKIYILGTH